MIQQKTNAQLEMAVNGILEDTSIALSDAVYHYLLLLKQINQPDLAQVFEAFASFYGYNRLSVLLS